MGGVLRLPRQAISIRQPWAWLIVNGWKNIENRMWRTSYRGPVLIHAAKGMTQDEYNACRLFMAGFCDPDRDVKLPHPVEMERGGIVGVATILDCVDDHESEWFCGEWGFVLADARPLPFYEFKGALSFFRCDYPQALLTGGGGAELGANYEARGTKSGAGSQNDGREPPARITQDINMESTPTTTKPTAGWLHELVQPFARDKTAEWKERQRITTLIEKIKDAATEAEECLEKDDLGCRKIEQAQTALAELEEAWLALRGLNDDSATSH